MEINCLPSFIFLCDQMVDIICFDQTAAILVCNDEHNLGRVPKLLRGTGVGGERLYMYLC